MFTCTILLVPKILLLYSETQAVVPLNPTGVAKGAQQSDVTLLQGTVRPGGAGSRAQAFQLHTPGKLPLTCAITGPPQEALLQPLCPRWSPAHLLSTSQAKYGKWNLPYPSKKAPELLKTILQEKP